MTHVRSASRVRAATSIALFAAVAGALAACKADDKVGPRDGSVVRFRATDPANDTLANADPSVDRALDLRSTSVRTKNDTIIFVLRFSGPVRSPAAGAANSAYGFIDLDTDQDGSTGIEASSDFAGGVSNMGVEYFIDIDEGDATSAPIGNDQLQQVGTATAVYAGDSAVFRIVRGDIGGDDGNFDFTVAVATIDRYSDIAPNSGHYTVSPTGTATVASLAAAPRLSVVAPGPRRTLRLRR